MSHQKVRIAYLDLFSLLILHIGSLFDLSTRGARADKIFVRVAFDLSDKNEGVLLLYDPSQQELDIFIAETDCPVSSALWDFHELVRYDNSSN
jgi:hypothetical protein